MDNKFNFILLSIINLYLKLILLLIKVKNFINIIALNNIKKVIIIPFTLFK